jgi:hypothetical protein
LFTPMSSSLRNVSSMERVSLSYIYVCIHTWGRGGTGGLNSGPCSC